MSTSSHHPPPSPAELFDTTNVTFVSSNFTIPLKRPRNDSLTLSSQHRHSPHSNDETTPLLGGSTSSSCLFGSHLEPSKPASASFYCTDEKRQEAVPEASADEWSSNAVPFHPARLPHGEAVPQELRGVLPSLGGCAKSLRDRDETALKLCINFLKYRRLTSAAEALKQEARVPDEHPIKEKLFNALVERGDYEELKRVLRQLCNEGRLRERGTHTLFKY